MSIFAATEYHIVSIQLMSPASGDSQVVEVQLTKQQARFHSINVPSEWGLVGYTELKIGLYNTKRFHSINVPSEWGLY